MYRKTILVKRAENEEEFNALSAFCYKIYGLAGKEKLEMPREFFGAYLDNEIVGTVGLFTKEDNKLLPTEEICGVTFNEATYEVARLSWIENLMPFKLDFIIGSLIHGVYYYLVEKKVEGVNSFVGIMKPKTLHYIKRLLGRDTFIEVPYEKINEERISPPLEKKFYLTPPQPVIFQTDCQKAGEKVRELLTLLNMKIRPVNLGA